MGMNLGTHVWLGDGLWIGRRWTDTVKKDLARTEGSRRGKHAVWNGSGNPTEGNGMRRYPVGAGKGNVQTGIE